VCYPHLPVILVGFLPGIMTPGGVSHQAIEDISLMRGLPNMTVLEVGDAADVESVLDIAYAVKGPVYVRMLRGAIPRLFSESMEFNRVRVLSEGRDLTIISSGICTEEVLKAVPVLKDAGYSVTHLHATTLKPFDDPRVDQALRETERLIVTVENHNVIGGLGAAVSERISEVGNVARHVRIGIPDTFGHGATAPYLMAKFGLDAPGILGRIADELGEQIDFHRASVTNAVVGVSLGHEQLEAL
jgi:transketolase